MNDIIGEGTDTMADQVKKTDVQIAGEPYKTYRQPQVTTNKERGLEGVLLHSCCYLTSPLYLLI